MSNLTETIIRTGILSQDTLRELCKWGLPISDFEPLDSPFEHLDAAMEGICIALESEESSELRQTDPDLINQYKATRVSGVLHLVAQNEESADFELYFGKVSNIGGTKYIIPNRAERLGDLLTNGKSYLKYRHRRIYFEDAQEYSFGDRKTFLVCIPVPRKKK